MNAVATKQPKGWGKLVASFALAFACIVIQAIATLPIIILTQSDDMELPAAVVGELVGGIVALLFVCALGGRQLLHCSRSGMCFALRAGAVILGADVILLAFSLISVFVDSTTPVSEHWPLNMVLVFAMSLGVGMYEEGMYRGLILHGLLARMGTSRSGIVGALVVSSLLFGLVHIFPADDLAWNAPSIAQAALNILQTGMFGFVMGVVVLKTRSLWPAVMLHGLSDFLLLIVDMGLYDNPLSTDYVTTGEDAAAVVVVYSVMCVVYLFPVLYCIRRLKELPVPDRGQFYRVRANTNVPPQQPVPPQQGWQPPQPTPPPTQGDYPVPPDPR